MDYLFGLFFCLVDLLVVLFGLDLLVWFWLGWGVLLVFHWKTVLVKEIIILHFLSKKKLVIKAGQRE